MMKFGWDVYVNLGNAVRNDSASKRFPKCV